MKKVLKIPAISLVILVLLIVLYLNYQTYFSSDARNGKRNIENIKKIEVGMGIKEVDSIMGTPDNILPSDAIRYPYTQYNYSTNDESYANVTVVFDSTFKVKETFYPH